MGRERGGQEVDGCGNAHFPSLQPGHVGGLCGDTH